jgi:Ulp1 protease family, C-terminal catalytic domain
LFIHFSSLTVFSGIYILDSVGSSQSGQSGRMFNTVMRYLAAKAEEQGVTFDRNNWNHLNAVVSGCAVQFYSIIQQLLLPIQQVPQQRNASDCGYYLLHFAETFLSAPWKLRASILVRVIRFCDLLSSGLSLTSHTSGEEKECQEMGSAT